MDVWIDPPRIDGETVTFRWRQSELNPFQEENAFFYRYEGLDLNHFTVELFYEIFLALQLRVFTGYAERVELHFPSSVPSFSVDYWRTIHRASNVSIEPIRYGGYDPWAGQPSLVERPKRAAVFFGGGKDSTLATCLLSEIYGPDQVVLIQFVGPLRRNPKLARVLEDRQERLMLEPARRNLGVATQRGWTNYQAIFRKEGYRLRPNLEIYTVGGLPALLSWGVELCSFTAPYTLMTVDERRTSDDRVRYSHARPEGVALLSRHYTATLGTPIQVTNVILPFHMLAVHWLLAERYPHALKQIVSCTLAGPDKRWCLDCAKCTLFAISGLSVSVLDPDFDYDRFLTTSHFIKRLIALSESGAEPILLGNFPWIRGFIGGPRSYILACHMVARIDLEAVAPHLGHEALANLAMVQAMYGNRLYPAFEEIPRVLLNLLGDDLGARIAEVVAEHFEIADRLPGPVYAANSPASYQFDRPIQLSAATLEHLQT